MFLEFFLNLVISTLLSELLKPKQHFDSPAAATLSNFNFPTSSENRPIPVVWGTRKQTSTNSLWQGDFVARPITETVRSSLFSKQTITTGYNYFLGMQLGLCIADVDAIESIWCQDVCVFQSTAGQQTINTSLPIYGSWQDGGQASGVSGTMVIRSGSDEPEPYMATQVTLNPSYRHMTSAVFVGPSASSALHYVGPTKGKGNGWVGGSTSIRPFDFVIRRMPKVVQYGVPQAQFDQYVALGRYDANLSYCMLELLCNSDWGAGVPPALVDLDSFVTAAAVLFAEGNGCSLLWDSQSACADIATELMKQANACLYTDLTTGLIKFHLVRATDAPKLALNDDNILELKSFTRAGTDEASNCISIAFNDTTNGFIDRVATAQDLGAVEMAGQVITSTVSYPGISDASLASTLSTRDLRAATASLSKFQLTAVLPLGTVLHPGDMLTLSFSPHGLTNLGVRVVSARYSDASKGEVDLTLVEDIFLPGSSVYAASLPGLGTGTGSRLPPVLPAAYLETWKAPYAWTGDDADHLMAVAYAPDTVTPGYDLAFYTSDPTVLEWHSQRGIGFAARGSTQIAIPATPTISSISFTVNASNAATLTRFGSRGVYFLLDTEEFFASSVGLVGSVATLGGIKRALHDTFPQAHSAGSQVTVLCDFAIDVARLRTLGYAEGNTGTPVVYFDGMDGEGVRALTRNAYGTSVDLSPAFSGGRVGGDFGADSMPPGSLRAALPTPPGKVQLAGQYGGADTGSATNVTIASGANAIVTFAPRNRLSLSDSAWVDGDAAGEPSVAYSVRLDKWNGSGWTNVNTTTVNAGATPQASFPTSGIARPTVVRVVIQPWRFVSGTTSVLDGLSQTWYWTIS
jgi:hypothetical protein